MIIFEILMLPEDYRVIIGRMRGWSAGIMVIKGAENVTWKVINDNKK